MPLRAEGRGGYFSHLVKKSIISNFPQLFILVLNVLKMCSTFHLRHRIGVSVQKPGSLPDLTRTCYPTQGRCIHFLLLGVNRKFFRVCLYCETSFCVSDTQAHPGLLDTGVMNNSGLCGDISLNITLSWLNLSLVP